MHLCSHNLSIVLFGDADFQSTEKNVLSGVFGKLYSQFLFGPNLRECFIYRLPVFGSPSLFDAQAKNLTLGQMVTENRFDLVILKRKLGASYRYFHATRIVDYSM